MAGDTDFREITACVLLHVARTPVNTTAMFQIKLVISSIETLVIQCLPQAHRLCTKEVARDVKYQENAGSFKESDSLNN